MPVELFPAPDFAEMIKGLLAGQPECAGLGASAHAAIQLQDPDAVEPIFASARADGSTGCIAPMHLRAYSDIHDLEDMAERSLPCAEGQGLAEPDHDDHAGIAGMRRRELEESRRDGKPQAPEPRGPVRVFRPAARYGPQPEQEIRDARTDAAHQALRRHHRRRQRYPRHSERPEARGDRPLRRRQILASSDDQPAGRPHERQHRPWRARDRHAEGPRAARTTQRMRCFGSSTSSAGSMCSPE